VSPGVNLSRLYSTIVDFITPNNCTPLLIYITATRGEFHRMIICFILEVEFIIRGKGHEGLEQQYAKACQLRFSQGVQNTAFIAQDFAEFALRPAPATARNARTSREGMFADCKIA
jgi:hypothetical protein